jgi:hypothetical protein
MKTKIFFGTKIEAATIEMNAWLEENPDVELLEFKYQHTTAHWHHSICILYRE